MTRQIARTDLDLAEYRKLLNEYKVQLTALRQKQRIGALGEAADTENESAYSCTDNSENGDTAAILADLEREFPAEATVTETLVQIGDALTRLNDGVYGLDEVTGEPIPKERLRAIPWATMTVETAERVLR